jgi:predicted methyltransferase
VREDVGPLLTARVHAALLVARAAGTATIACSLDLDRSVTAVQAGSGAWVWEGRQFPFLQACKDRTVYYWTGTGFEPVARFGTSLIKLVPTQWGPPTFEIDGIKMLPTARVSPYEDAARKVGLIQPRGKTILDTCGGLGYFAAWCLRGAAASIRSYEKNPDVIWLRSLNPWSPDSPWSRQQNSPLTLTKGDITELITTLPDESVDAVLHDPPRFGIAGELFSRTFYDQLARVLRRNGKLFHYTGTPNKLSRGRNLQNEVANRLRSAGFAVDLEGDDILAIKTRRL